jgi:hypothetical protein
MKGFKMFTFKSWTKVISEDNNERYNLLPDDYFNTTRYSKIIICEKCENYKMVDSAYGYCRYNPPIEYATYCIYWKWYFIPILRKVTYVDYITVPWCLIACSHFKLDKRYENK